MQQLLDCIHLSSIESYYRMRYNSAAHSYFFSRCVCKISQSLHAPILDSVPFTTESDRVFYNPHETFAVLTHRSIYPSHLALAMVQNTCNGVDKGCHF